MADSFQNMAFGKSSGLRLVSIIAFIFHNKLWEFDVKAIPIWVLSFSE